MNINPAVNGGAYPSYQDAEPTQQFGGRWDFQSPTIADFADISTRKQRKTGFFGRIKQWGKDHQFASFAIGGTLLLGSLAAIFHKKIPGLKKLFGNSRSQQPANSNPTPVSPHSTPGRSSRSNPTPAQSSVNHQAPNQEPLPSSQSPIISTGQQRPNESPHEEDSPLLHTDPTSSDTESISAHMHTPESESLQSESLLPQPIVSESPLSLALKTSAEDVEKCIRELTPENARQIMQSRVEQSQQAGVNTVVKVPPIITYKGQKLELKALGAGGTKEAFETTINGQRVVLGICGETHMPGNFCKKWQDVLEEPARTAELRNKNILVNEHFQILPIEINGVPFPAAAMKHFKDHEFEIHDVKNSAQNTENSAYQWDRITNDEEFLNSYSEMIKDMRNLSSVKSKKMGLDSVNIAVKDGNPRLYIMDIPYSKEQFYDIAMTDEASAKHIVNKGWEAFTGTIASHKTPYYNYLYMERSGYREESDQLVDEVDNLTESEWDRRYEALEDSQYPNLTRLKQKIMEKVKDSG